MPTSIGAMFVSIGMMFTTLGLAQHNNGFSLAGILVCIVALIIIVGGRKR